MVIQNDGSGTGGNDVSSLTSPSAEAATMASNSQMDPAIVETGFSAHLQIKNETTSYQQITPITAMARETPLSSSVPRINFFIIHIGKQQCRSNEEIPELISFSPRLDPCLA